NGATWLGNEGGTRSKNSGNFAGVEVVVVDAGVVNRSRKVAGFIISTLGADDPCIGENIGSRRIKGGQVSGASQHPININFENILGIEGEDNMLPFPESGGAGDINAIVPSHRAIVPIVK